MILYLTIVITAILALLVDVYIYLRVIRRHNFGRIWKVGYLIYAILTDIAVVLALIFYKTLVDWDGTVVLRIAMAIIGLFFLNVVPKTVYAIISLGDYLIQSLRKNKTSHIFGYLGTLAALVAFSVVGYSMTWGRSQIRVERVELEFENLPPSFDGLTIAHFSDTHIGTIVRRERFFTRMVDTINRLKPDIVVNSGDLVNAHVWEIDDKLQRVFSRIESKYGVYSVLGNHDLGIYIRDTVKHPRNKSLSLLIEKQKDMGWIVLQNESAFINNGKDSIAITGIDYPEDNTLNSHSKIIVGADVEGSFRNVPDSIFDITISHAPQIWNEILEKGKADLTLAGHVHAMQMKLRLGNWFLWSPAMLKYDRWSGLYEEDGHYLYINDGMGYVIFPMRVGVKPEITIYTLRTKK